MKAFLFAILIGLLFFPVAQAEKIGVNIFIIDGQLTAARNQVKDSVLDPAGGGLDEFGLDIQRVGGGGPGWNGAGFWVMEREGLATVSFESFRQLVIEELSMKWNTGAPNVQVVTYIHCLELALCQPGDDYGPEISPLLGFEAALADTTKKPWALERVPTGPEP